MIKDVTHIRVNDVMVLKYPGNGYDHQKIKAKELIEMYGPDKEYTVKSITVENFYSYMEFYEVPGYWNTVQFDYKS